MSTPERAYTHKYLENGITADEALRTVFYPKANSVAFNGLYDDDMKGAKANWSTSGGSEKTFKGPFIWKEMFDYLNNMQQPPSVAYIYVHSTYTSDSNNNTAKTPFIVKNFDDAGNIITSTGPEIKSYSTRMYYLNNITGYDYIIGNRAGIEKNYSKEQQYIKNLSSLRKKLKNSKTIIVIKSCSLNQSEASLLASLLGAPVVYFDKSQIQDGYDLLSINDKTGQMYRSNESKQTKPLNYTEAQKYFNIANPSSYFLSAKEFFREKERLREGSFQFYWEQLSGRDFELKKIQDREIYKHDPGFRKIEEVIQKLQKIEKNIQSDFFKNIEDKGKNKLLLERNLDQHDKKQIQDNIKKAKHHLERIEKELNNVRETIKKQHQIKENYIKNNNLKIRFRNLILKKTQEFDNEMKEEFKKSNYKFKKGMQQFIEDYFEKYNNYFEILRNGKKISRGEKGKENQGASSDIGQYPDHADNNRSSVPYRHSDHYFDTSSLGSAAEKPNGPSASEPKAPDALGNTKEEPPSEEERESGKKFVEDFFQYDPHVLYHVPEQVINTIISLLDAIEKQRKEEEKKNKEEEKRRKEEEEKKNKEEGKGKGNNFRNEYDDELSLHKTLRTIDPESTEGLPNHARWLYSHDSGLQSKDKAPRPGQEKEPDTHPDAGINPNSPPPDVEITDPNIKYIKPDSASEIYTGNIYKSISFLQEILLKQQERMFVDSSLNTSIDESQADVLFRRKIGANPSALPDE